MSLEWVAQQAYYETRGSGAFLGGDVPFVGTSGGRLSHDAAAILFAALEHDALRAGPIRCLELGPGTGLFAKLLLDGLRRRCAEHGRDYYDRLTLVLADSSSAMLDAIVAGGVLSEHAGRFELRRVDPRRPAVAAEQGELRAVFLNYVLDNLPTSLVRRGPAGLEQLCVRFRVGPGIEMGDYTTLAPAQLAEHAHAGEAGALRALGELRPVLIADGHYEPVDPSNLPEAEALEGIWPESVGETIVHGHDAIACLRDLSQKLAPGGFILINDFLPRARGREEAVSYPVFGGAVAIGVNLVQLERAVARWRGMSWHAPAADPAPIVSRLIGRHIAPGTVSCFAARFDPTTVEARYAALDWIDELIEDRAVAEAAAELERALAAAPWDWTLHERAAPLFAYLLKDRDRATVLAHQGLGLNPLSTGLWNVLGDCELHRRRLTESLQCFARAMELNPREVRGRYNASYPLAAMGDLAGALRMIDDALPFDDGAYRERLLRRRERILERRRRQASSC
jgi:tetratricopeptide (TPR) repeat protein